MNEFASVLQQAICEVAGEEFARLSAGKTPRAQLDHIATALESLGGLQSGTAPAYDEWQALFYITWYQYAHINLASTVLHELFGGRPLQKPVHIVDLGCGAMATQFAVALYLATTPSPWSPAPRITVHNIDPSACMRRIGRIVWDRLRMMSFRHSNLASLSRACSLIASHDMSADKELAMVDRSARPVLVAMHAVYDTNKVPLRSSIERIRSRCRPMDTVMTCHERSSHLAEFAGGDGAERIGAGPGMLVCDPEEITAWRRDLLRQLEPLSTDHIVSRFLPGSVPATPKSSIILRWRSDKRR